MALFEHVLVLKQELSTADLENELKNHSDTITDLSWEQQQCVLWMSFLVPWMALILNFLQEEQEKNGPVGAIKVKNIKFLGKPTN